MTEDYKKSLIDYVSGLLKIEQPQPTDFDPNELPGTGVIKYSSNRWSDVITAFSGKNVSINGILENENYDKTIMYGGYLNGDTGNSQAFLIYIDEYGFPTKVRLLNWRGIQCLKFDDINNRVYGVLGDRANSPVANDNDAYFVYFNNLFLTEDDANPPELQYSYKIHTDSGTNYFMARDIVKHPEKSWYMIYATNYSGLLNTRVLELQINVGQSNQLKTWSIGSGYYSYGFYGWYNGDTPHFKTIISDSGNVYDFILATDNGDNVSYTNLSCDTTISKPQVSSIRPLYVATNENKIYFVYNVSYIENADTKKQCCLYLYDGTTTIKTSYKTDVIIYENGHHDIPILNVVRDVNTIYCIRVLNDEENDVCQLSVANISDNSTPTEDNFEFLGTGEYIYRFNTYNFNTILRRNYNIVYFNSYCGYMREGLGTTTNDINGFSSNIGRVKQRIGYTGEPYSYYSVLVPRYVNLYYAGVALMFSRNVYNITRFNNTTTASVEVPSKYLNNYPIGREKLFGITGYELVRENRLISKNQYEVLHINYINTINVWDEDRNITYQLPAIKVNNSITTGTQQVYENTRCTKYRVNYTDNTTLVNTITWSNINDLNKQTYFVISVNKAIQNIELISNDETTTYMVINGSFKVGKDYLITQKVRIGNRPTSNDLQYNGENVLYGNQQVKVYSQ